ncbi:SDR family NAD(P)-dependent oxidoreductase [Streptomyces sp. cg40]|uniref:SDR family NAD(P)-dependent oxidoreductase n=1 Tax=Streptomyces sp. cg40 TaxID=3419764 RepID=UPI003D08BEA8
MTRAFRLSRSIMWLYLSESTRRRRSVVSGRDERRGAEVVARIEKDGDTGAFVQADLSGGAEVIDRFATEARTAAGGRIDVLVNNAALILPPAPPPRSPGRPSTRRWP